VAYGVSQPGKRYALDPAEFDQLKVTLKGASDALGLRDFKAKASLEGTMTVQSVSPYENVEETVDGAIMALTKFVDQDYAATSQTMHDFINRVHTTIETAIDVVHKTQQEYLEAERLVGDSLRRAYPE
jgi:dihydroxyacetone kinase-like predicted kinase